MKNRKNVRRAHNSYELCKDIATLLMLGALLIAIRPCPCIRTKIEEAIFPKDF